VRHHPWTGLLAGLTLSSPAFPAGGPIPTQFTCDGANVSPPLTWSGVPHGARSLALLCDDPDARSRVWVHWVIYRIPPGATGLPEHLAGSAQLPDGARQGRNDFGQLGYGGPCPPSGTHHYRFTLFALDTELTLAPGATKEQLLAEMNGHIIGEVTRVGTYHRVR